uniref:Uncharacterized protein n=1 Tax=viral metagenome TaxID=1070528 RepID=A0A6C0KXE4_9ZZZZ
MTSNIVPPSTFDATKLSFGDMKSLDSGGKIVDISYDGRRNLLTQTASMVLPYGLNVYDKAGPVSYSVDVSFRGVEENPKIAAFHDMLAAFDSAVMEAGVKNSLLWLGIDPKSEPPATLRSLVKRAYTPCLKIALDKNTKQPKPYPPTLKLKLPKDNGAFKTQFYDQNKQRIEGTTVEDLLVKGAQGTFLIKCTSIWFAGAKFGASWKAEQVRMESVPQGMRGCAILDDEEDEDAPVAKPVAKRAAPVNRFAVAEDDEEETEDVVAAVMPVRRAPVAAPAVVEDEEEEDIVEAPVVPTKKTTAQVVAGVKKVVKKTVTKA